MILLSLLRTTLSQSLVRHSEMQKRMHSLTEMERASLQVFSMQQMVDILREHLLLHLSPMTFLILFML